MERPRGGGWRLLADCQHQMPDVGVNKVSDDPSPQPLSHPGETQPWWNRDGQSLLCSVCISEQRIYRLLSIAHLGGIFYRARVIGIAL